ncbi:insulinase family protein [Paucibacter sp. DJ1R-11]|uniref:M16 family metallopeptidase n=1 Tax=Paucibacter sp. DJ1R-11 TaxID=2893556 RepID=UPI0021E45B43|nr:pitrilysin family protein [Paucibacter sp. DJ1R-11]MCV2362225.1 insulinase family protein [Paucibacter sp. DJ1R-11]
MKPHASPRSATQVSRLANDLRTVAIPMPWRETISLSVFIRTGSLHESARLNGISHVVEHMAFKGTASRDCQRINLDAEALGAELNAHTDKDHTAFHIEGLPSDLPAFIELLADIVLNSSFPAEELERERGVIVQEFSEFEDDPTSAAFQLLDRACYGAAHAAGRPIIGTRANILRFSRDDLLAYVRAQYSASNVVVAVAGPIDASAFERAVAAAFGAMPAGSPHTLSAPSWQGGLKTRRMAGSGQCQILLGFPAPSLGDVHSNQHLPHVLAAALLGEGMSSPLLDEIRERRGLAYHVACSADILPLYGQFVIEGATAPAQAEEFLQAVHQLLHHQAQGPLDPVALARARKQLQMRGLRALEQPARRMESAAQELFSFGRLRDAHEAMAQLQAVTAAQVQAVFETLLQAGQRPAVALAGSVPQRVRARAAELFA